MANDNLITFTNFVEVFFFFARCWITLVTDTDRSFLSMWQYILGETGSLVESNNNI